MIIIAAEFDNHQTSIAMSEEKKRYSKDELKEFEALLLSKLEVAKKELAISKAALTRKDDTGTTSTTGGNFSLESGAETAEKESLNQLAGRQSTYVKNLEYALIRIKNGTYGICATSGDLISKERLMAVPHTTQSIAAKNNQ